MTLAPFTPQTTARASTRARRQGRWRQTAPEGRPTLPSSLCTPGGC